MKQRVHNYHNMLGRMGLTMKKTKDTKKLTLRQEVIRILTSNELKTVIGAAGACHSDTSSVRTQEAGVTTC